MRSVRQCSRTACPHAAVATLTYVYADSTAVLGPLAQHAEPHSYDLCVEHAERLTAPRGWEVVRLLPDLQAAAPSHDDLVALAEAVREAGRRRAPDPVPDLAPAAPAGVDAARRRGHLRIVPGAATDGGA
ncbi:MAG: DUF3499 domain-containing protein [Cellulomonas iranensis]|uniref:DUF3499 domain-containing protein n=1 Tax=Cellulomonas iranensis TaxID=76862 RepID=A0ABU0GMD4_9CELL|nr:MULTISPECIES: DUF3499 domain-containing protein [Cellulomonas]MBO9569583.1 DUF3499 domain-containing protein [Cellulomonas iranensis]MDQ0426530.1 hypothetical protein [Cellulomonas iranensis]TFH74184.1 DUF3499 domain-containing protein [Cellulomonas sp. HD19AZ1]UCN15930.1 DUF3499 domain-containing protein [Cellulomonas iranensis]